MPNVVCFDTAFHTTIPEAARTYAIPARFRETVRLYGFHGLFAVTAREDLQIFAEARTLLSSSAPPKRPGRLPRR